MDRQPQITDKEWEKLKKPTQDKEVFWKGVGKKVESTFFSKNTKKAFYDENNQCRIPLSEPEEGIKEPSASQNQHAKSDSAEETDIPAITSDPEEPSCEMEPNAEHTACEEQAKRNIEEETLITHSVGHAGHTRENEEFIELSEMKPGELVTFSHNRKDLIKTSNNLCESKNHTEDSPNTVNCADTVVEATQHKEHEGRNYFTTTELETVTKLSSNQKDREIDLYQVEAPRAIDSVNSGGTTVHNEERDINGNHYQHLPKNSLVPPQKGKDNQPANNCTVSQDHEVDDLYQDVAPRATVSVNHGGSTVHTEEGKIYGNHDQHLPKNSLVPPHKGKAIQPMSNFVSQHKLQALIDKTNPSSVRMDGTLQNRDMEKKFEEIGSAAESVDLPKKFPINLGDHLEDKEDLSHTVIVRSIRGNPDKETSKYRRLKTKKQQTKLGNVPHTNKICSDLLRNTFRILWWFSEFAVATEECCQECMLVSNNLLFVPKRYFPVSRNDSKSPRSRLSASEP